MGKRRLTVRATKSVALSGAPFVRFKLEQDAPFGKQDNAVLLANGTGGSLACACPYDDPLLGRRPFDGDGVRSGTHWCRSIAYRIDRIA